MKEITTESTKGLLFDATRCVGCGACYFACKRANGLPAGRNDPLGDELSSETFTVLRRAGGRFVRSFCRHCNDPACVSVCPVRGLEKTPEGPVVYHPERCMGCRYCMQACPLAIPRYEWNLRMPRVRKCEMCKDRVLAGEPTACSVACPNGATKFGLLKDLAEEAKRRIREAPDKYHDRVYGLEDFGGTSVLMIADVPLDAFGAHPPGTTTEPLPDLTLNVLRKLPHAVAVGSVLLGGICWITRRRMQIQEESARRARGSGPPGEEPADRSREPIARPGTSRGEAGKEVRP